MLDSFGSALRTLRHGHDMTLDELAVKLNYTKTHLSLIETGKRVASAAVAKKCDAAFGTSPTLVRLLAIEKGNDMLRRVLFGGTFGVIGGALLSNIDGRAALAATLNAAMRINLDDPDWDAIADEFDRRYVHAGADYGPELAAQIMIAHQRFIDGDAEAGRCAARLTMLYGLWSGDNGHVATANSLYATAAAVADGTKDQPLRAWIRARAASRGPYEGWTAKHTAEAAQRALSLATTGPAAVEAHGAVVHLAALTGRIGAGRQAIRAAYDAAGTDDHLRVMSFDCYLECRAGTLADAQVAHDRVYAALAPIPRWQHEADIYLGRAMVAAGDINDGAQLALNAIRTLPSSTRIVALGVADVLAVVPAGVQSEAVTALRGYAAPGPTPWETIR